MILTEHSVTDETQKIISKNIEHCVKNILEQIGQERYTGIEQKILIYMATFSLETEILVQTTLKNLRDQ